MDKSAMRAFASLFGEVLLYQHQRIVTMTKVYIASNRIHVEIIRFHTIETLVTLDTRQQRAHCYPRRVATVLSRQPIATSLLARRQLTIHRHQVVSTGDVKGGSRPHPSHNTKGKTVRAHCQYTSDRQYNYNNKLYNSEPPASYFERRKLSATNS